jgi:pimeloyl-ACP methyl ester carboxylesterase
LTSDLEVLVDGTGPRVVLIHGSVMPADLTWTTQMPLAARWTLVRPNRRGFGRSPDIAGEDFQQDARDIASVVEAGDHLVGYSYGGVGALMAAPYLPDLRSLTVIEPPACGVARGVSEVEEFIDGFKDIFANEQDVAVAAHRFTELVGSPNPLPDPVPDVVLHGTNKLLRCRMPDEAAVDLPALRSMPYPKLVVKGEGHAGLLKVCDVLIGELDADHVTISGVKHMIPFCGQPLNEALESFWSKAS